MPHQPALIPDQPSSEQTERDAERAEYLERLREHLRDPDFRAIEGFPIGDDEAILALSDPPYYTACPNPFVEDIIKQYGKPYNPSEPFTKEPFAYDVTEGRHTWLYKAHTYHTKVPPKAVQAYIEYYTEPNDIVLDGFAGSGMTGVASMLAELSRSALICDLSPAASFISSMYLAEVNPDRFAEEAQRLIAQLDDELGWMYSPIDESGRKSFVNYYIWSDVFVCSSCSEEIVFWDVAFDPLKKEFRDSFRCPACHAENSKTSAERAKETSFDTLLGKPWTRFKQVPVLAAVKVRGRRHRKRRVNHADLELIQKVVGVPFPPGARRFAVKMLSRDGQWGDQWKNCMHLRTITHAHQLFALRQLHYVGRFLDLLDLSIPEHRALLFTGTSVLQKTSRLMVYNADGIGRVQKGTLYISSVWQEMRFSHMLSIAVDDMLRAVQEGLWSSLPQRSRAGGSVRVAWAGSATALQIPDNSVDYVFVDPPFGANIPYSEVNFLWEAALGVFTNSGPDAIESEVQGKSLADYQRLMQKCFQEFHRVLKPERWMTVEFHNSKNSVWNAIQEALLRAGFMVADVRILDKKQKSFKQATTVGAVKQDLIISTYKPNESLEERFKIEAGTEEGMWAFVRQHLARLPVVVERDGSLEVVAERQAYLLFDRMVAFHIQRGATVPLSAAEFYAGLRQRFVERDGMFFLPDQVPEYDRARLQATEVAQLTLFVSDEKSSIQWLRQQLDSGTGGYPQTYQELQPQFLRQLHQARHETLPELSEILEQSFLQDEAGRWYVPDPNRASDLEKLRQRALLREFAEYVEGRGRLRQFRTEAVRAGFADAWRRHDYTTIVKVAERLPEAVLQEDPDLLMYYDNATLRVN